jgi:hypothetical protein
MNERAAPTGLEITPHSFSTNGKAPPEPELLTKLSWQAPSGATRLLTEILQVIIQYKKRFTLYYSNLTLIYRMKVSTFKF